MAKNIVTRLTEQLVAKGMSRGKARAVALKRMKKSGNVTKGGKLTEKGRRRSVMGAAGRAKDRASKYSGRKHKPSDYKYNPRTNIATLKKKKK